MTSSQLLFLLIVFAIAGALVFFGMVIFAPGSMRERLDSVRDSGAPRAELSALESDGWVERVVKVAQPFSKLSLPEEGWERSALHTRFMNAGWRNRSMATLYFGAKSTLALVLPLLMALILAQCAPAMSLEEFMFMLMIAVAIGYYFPNLLLGNLIQRRKREIFETIPDALDLLTVCVEAGLSLERALIKVAGEIHIKSLVLAEELQLVLMEMRAGFTKDKALRNFALRSGVEDVDTLVAMLIQSERFGTSMGASLRVHSDNLRNKRQMKAEETASKIALKLLFPLIFFIFPSLLIVLVGPAGISLAAAFGKLGAAN